MTQNMHTLIMFHSNYCQFILIILLTATHQNTKKHSGTVTITSQPSLVSSKPSPIGPPQCAAILSCSKRGNNTSGKLSPNVTTPNGPWTKWRKDLTGLPDRSMMGATILPSLPTMECKVRVTLSYPTHK